MTQPFLGCHGEQVLWLPPDVRDWRPEGHLAGFVLDAVAAMDLGVFYGAYRQRRARAGSVRADDDGGAGEEDVVSRMIAAHQVSDHTTVARFRQRHQDALGWGVGDVLALCAEAGLVDVECDRCRRGAPAR